MTFFQEPIETGIQLGDTTYLTLYEGRTLHVVVFKKKELLIKVSEKDFDKFQIQFHNDMVSGSNSIKLKKLVEELKKPQKNLFIRIRRELKRNFDLLKPKDYDILTAYVISTFLFTKLQAIPYIHLHAPKGSGKTTVLKTLSHICFNGEQIVNPTQALARMIDGKKPTLLIDESEELFDTRSKSERVQQIQQIYNTGYQLGSKVVRYYQSKKTGKWREEAFYNYCPKVFASIREINAVLRDRCIPVNLIRSDKHFSLRRTELNDLMHEILAYCMKNHAKIIDNIPNAINILKKHKIYGRTQELLIPMVAIADYFGENIVEHVKTIDERKKQYEESINSDEQIIIQALHNIFESKAETQAYLDLYDIKKEMQIIYESEPVWLTNYYLSQLMHRIGFDQTARRGRTGRIHFLIDKEEVNRLVYFYNVSTDWEGKLPSTTKDLKESLIPKKVKWKKK